MSATLCLVLERTIDGFDKVANTSQGLAWVSDKHPALIPLLDNFYSSGLSEVASMLGLSEADDLDELQAMNIASEEWFEATPGLLAAQSALHELNVDSSLLSAFLYGTAWTVSQVMSDLEAIEHTLVLAQQHEVRFHFAMDV